MAKKSRRLEIRLSDEEYLLVERASEGRCVSMGEYIRMCVFGGVLVEVTPCLVKTNIDELPPPSYILPDKPVSWNRPILNTEEERLKKLDMVRAIPLDVNNYVRPEDVWYDENFEDVFKTISNEVQVIPD